MQKIDINTMDANLLADIDGDTTGYELHEQEADGASGVWQILWHTQGGRAGLVYVGSGSNGATLWTDAVSPEEAYRRLQNDEMSA